MKKENKGQINNGLRKILSHPIVYNLYQRMVGIDKLYSKLVNEIILPNEHAKILDIGCGDGYILSFLPQTTIYVGYDISSTYIDFAKKKYKGRGTFYNKRVSEMSLEDKDLFDIVIAIGLLHHLDENEAREVFRLGYSLLKKDGVMFTVDNCYFEGQSPIARFISSKDRGKNVNYPEGYEMLAKSSFGNIQTFVRDNLMSRIPQTFCILKCSKDKFD